MNIGIIGGGSIGLLFAYYLNQNATVTIYTRTAEQAEKINTDGICLKYKEHLQHTYVTAKTLDSWLGQDELTIVTVKQYQLSTVLKKISGASGYGRLLFLQNGMGHIKPLKKIKNNEIYIGSVEHGAYRDSATSVTHNGVGVTRLAVLNGEIAFLKDFISKSPNLFPFTIEENYYEMLIKKLVVNAIINPLTAVLRVRNGELMKNPHYYIILKNMFQELMMILKLDRQDQYFEQVLKVCENTANNRSSMLKDIEHHRETEVDAILGYLLEEAEIKGVQAPLIQTFYHLVKGISLQKGAD
jgi:2-dehydropantoate 2-reductase